MPKSITSMKFVDKPAVRMQDPIANRRSKFVGGLNKQLILLKGNGTDKIRPWFSKKGTAFIASVRYRNSPIELDGGNAFFELPNKEALVKVYTAIAKEAHAGEWDEILDNKVKSMKKAGGRKKQPVAR